MGGAPLRSDVVFLIRFGREDENSNSGCEKQRSFAAACVHPDRETDSQKRLNMF